MKQKQTFNTNTNRFNSVVCGTVDFYQGLRVRLSFYRSIVPFLRRKYRRRRLRYTERVNSFFLSDNWRDRRDLMRRERMGRKRAKKRERHKHLI